MAKLAGYFHGKPKGSSMASNKRAEDETFLQKAAGPVFAALVVAVVIGQFNLGNTVIRISESINNDRALTLRNQANIDRIADELHELQIDFAAQANYKQ